MGDEIAYSTNFIPIALKIVLVEFVLVETVLVVGDPLYWKIVDSLEWKAEGFVHCVAVAGKRIFLPRSCQTDITSAKMKLSN